MKKIILFLGLTFCFSILSYSQDDVKNNAVSAANDAATKVKTITQLQQTLMEAIQSGWAKSWKIIV
jgi:hypothetical protein